MCKVCAGAIIRWVPRVCALTRGAVTMVALLQKFGSFSCHLQFPKQGVFKCPQATEMVWSLARHPINQGLFFYKGAILCKVRFAMLSRMFPLPLFLVCP